MKKGFKFSEEHKNKISSKLKGRKLSEEHRKNMSLAKKGKIPNCAKPVKIIYKNVEYNFKTMTEAENYFAKEMDLKIFYWLRNRIPRKHINDIQFIQVKDKIVYKA